MRRVKNDGDGVVDFTTFLCPVESEFVPRLNHEHSSFGWSDPEIALAENRADSMAVAGSQGAELERTLDAGLLADEVERRANVEGEDPGEDLDEATLALILQELEALEERL